MTTFRFFIGFVLILFSSLFIHVQARNRMLGIIFVEKGTRLIPRQMHRAVLQQLRFVQQEFFSNFGATFELDRSPVRIVSADHPGDYYENTISSAIPGNSRVHRFWRLENIREEVIRKLQLDDEVRVLVYPTSKRDGKVGAYVNTPIGQGAYMDFDDLTCRYNGGESTPFGDGTESVSNINSLFWDGNQNAWSEELFLTVTYFDILLSHFYFQVCGAHELHELGHVFGLSHEGPSDDCMQFGFYKDFAPSSGVCKFSQSNRDKVRRTQSGWLTKTSMESSQRCNISFFCQRLRRVTLTVGQRLKDPCGKFYRVFPGCELRQICRLLMRAIGPQSRFCLAWTLQIPVEAGSWAQQLAFWGETSDQW